jgi:hypothetical protein
MAERQSSARTPTLSFKFFIPSYRKVSFDEPFLFDTRVAITSRIGPHGAYNLVAKNSRIDEPKIVTLWSPSHQCIASRLMDAFYDCEFQYTPRKRQRSGSMEERGTA